MKTTKKLSAMTICLLLAILFTVGGTIAFLYAKTDAVNNSFTAPMPDIDIPEEFDEVVKENVRVQVLDLANMGVESFIRAKIVVNWQETEAGVDNVLSTLPASDTDYVLNLNLNNAKENDPDIEGRWVLHSDGYYYFTQPVKPEGTTEVLITSAYQTGEAFPGYYLHIEILAQSIQSTPIEAVQQTWGVTIAGDTVTDYTAG